MKRAETARRAIHDEESDAPGTKHGIDARFESPGPARMSPAVDHLIFGVPDLTDGMDLMESLLGTRPTIGGRHPRFGTHNALLSLGPSTYLEVIAPDLRWDAAGRERVFGIDGVHAPRMLSWMVRTDDVDELVARARRAGLALGAVQSGSRTKPDGTTLEWRLTDPYAMQFDGALPFVIAWGDTPHPAATAPPAGALGALRIRHPDAERLRAAVAIIGPDVAVEQAPSFELEAVIATPSGNVVLR